MSGSTNGLVHLMLLFWMWWYTRIRVVYNDLVLRIDTIILSEPNERTHGRVVFGCPIGNHTLWCLFL